MGQGKPLNTLDRLLSRCARSPEGCLVWQGATARSGHGRIAWRRTGSQLVHRIVWQELVGPIPEGHEIHHDCRNPACCDVRHLRCVTRKEHADAHPELGPTRAWRGALTHCKRGHPFDPENTRIDARGQRSCLACHRDHNRVWMSQHYRDLPSYQNRRQTKKADGL